MVSGLLNAEYSKNGFQNLKQKELEGKTEPLYYSEWTGLGIDWLILQKGNVMER